MMLFDSPESRNAYFHELAQDPHLRVLNYGDAMAHASSVNLGLWGNVEALVHDCARVMRYELLKYRQELDDGQQFEISPERIMHTDAFRRAFQIARMAPSNKVENLLTHILPSCQDREMLRETITANEGREVRGAHVAIYRELGGIDRHEQDFNRRRSTNSRYRFPDDGHL